MKRQTTDLKQQQAKIYHFNLLTQRLYFFLFARKRSIQKKFRAFLKTIQL